VKMLEFTLSISYIWQNRSGLSLRRSLSLFCSDRGSAMIIGQAIPRHEMPEKLDEGVPLRIRNHL